MYIYIYIVLYIYIYIILYNIVYIHTHVMICWRNPLASCLEHIKVQVSCCFAADLQGKMQWDGLQPEPWWNRWCETPKILNQGKWEEATTKECEASWGKICTRKLGMPTWNLDILGSWWFQKISNNPIEWWEMLHDHVPKLWTSKNCIVDFNA
jgi:hypothetical protein